MVERLSEQFEVQEDETPERPTRRVFLRGAVALPPLIAALFAATITVSCDDSSDDDDASGDDADGVSGSISGNHGHTCTITQAELDAGDAVTLSLTTGNGHTHALALTATQVQDIAGGTTVTQTSTTASGHSHGVTFN